MSTLNTKEILDDEETLKTSGEAEQELGDVIDKINKKNEPEGGWKEEDLIKEARAMENEVDIARGIRLISDLVSEDLAIDDGELMQKMKESGLTHEDAQTALNKAFESKTIAYEEGMGSVSGPPAGTEPTVLEEEDNTFVMPSKNELNHL